MKTFEECCNEVAKESWEPPSAFLEYIKRCLAPDDYSMLLKAIGLLIVTTSETDKERDELKKANKILLEAIESALPLKEKIQSLHKGESNDLMDKGWNEAIDHIIETIFL